ncbi:hypothetical protein Bpfe_018910, partial [Biomphalaria pfeifferi]
SNMGVSKRTNTEQQLHSKEKQSEGANAVGHCHCTESCQESHHSQTIVGGCQCSGICSESLHNCRPTSVLEVTSSSQAILEQSCNRSLHTGAVIENHLQSHQLRTHLLTVPGQTNSSNLVPDSVFLTSSAHRHSHHHDRPFSAPASYLEQISGQLLRLVGDHYLCSNCGRQLRNMGDELTLEKSLRHAVSSIELNNVGSS